jgi:hypothetical protein
LDFVVVLVAIILENWIDISRSILKVTVASDNNLATLSEATILLLAVRFWRFLRVLHGFVESTRKLSGETEQLEAQVEHRDAILRELVLMNNRVLNHQISDKEFRLWILNYSTDGKIIGAQTRRMKGYGQRYLTYDLPKLYEEMGKPLDMTNEELNTLTKISTLFGIMQLNFQRPITMFEGPLDSMFMNNSLALATAGRSTDDFDEIPTVRYMFDNDATGKKKMAEKLKRGRPVFMWTKFLKENKLDTYNIKDLNDLILKCFELKIDAHKKIDNYFTSNQLDLWYV